MAIAVLDEVEIGAVSRTEKLLGFLDRDREEFAGSDLLEAASTQRLVRGCFFREVLLRAEDFRPKAA